MFSYYPGDIAKSKSIGTVGYTTFVEAHRNPKIQTRKLVDEIKEASLRGDLELKKHLKTRLYSFTPSVLVGVGQRRKYANILGFTGIMQLDFDKFDTEETTLLFKEHLFENYEEILCAYTSPSRLGVKALMRIKTPKDVEHYKAIHRAVSVEFSNIPNFDSATKNPILPLFLSYDEEILSREFDEATIWTDEDWSEIEQLKTQEFDVTQSSGTKLELKVINSTKQHINAIVDDGHPQVRRAGLILGSRIAAGYISQSLGEGLIKDLIRNNNYLSKGISGYEKTVDWAIKQGMKSPRYYDDDK